MRYITLPGTSLTVSQIQLGTAEFGVVPTHEGMYNKQCYRSEPFIKESVHYFSAKCK